MSGTIQVLRTGLLFLGVSWMTLLELNPYNEGTSRDGHVRFVLSNAFLERQTALSQVVGGQRMPLPCDDLDQSQPNPRDWRDLVSGELSMWRFQGNNPRIHLSLMRDDDPSSWIWYNDSSWCWRHCPEGVSCDDMGTYYEQIVVPDRLIIYLEHEIWSDGNNSITSSVDRNALLRWHLTTSNPGPIEIGEWRFDPCDLNMSGGVDLDDVILFFQHMYDYNQDGRVDALDAVEVMHCLTR